MATTVLTWGAFALVAVVVVRLGLRALRRPHDTEAGGSPDPSHLLVPPPATDRYARATWTGWSTADGGSDRRPLIAAGIILVALVAGGTGALLFPRAEEPRVPALEDGPREWRQLARVPTAVTPTATPEAAAATAVDPETGERLVLWSGDGQTGHPGRVLLRSLGVVVLDSTGRPIPGRAIRFDVAPGGGTLDATEVRTTSSGLALTSWRLGRDPGALAVRASLADRPGVSVRFTASLGGAEDAGRPDLSETAAAEPGPESEPDAPPTPDGASEVGEPAEAGAEAVAVAVEPGPGAEPGAGGDTAGPEPGAAAEPLPGAGDPAPAVATGRAMSWAPGGMHTCRVEGGGVVCLGAGRAPRTAAAPVRSVGAGVSHVCGITTSSTVACWAVASGGASAITGERSLPGGATPAEVAVGSEHVCVRSTDGAVYCWGSNTRGQLGVGSGDRDDPARVPGLEGVVRLAGGWFHTCALTASGQLYCWGANGSGQLGIGSVSDRRNPGRVPRPAPFTWVTAGSAHTCALAGGAAWCWGENRYGQLGIGSDRRSTRPARVDTELPFAALAAGGVHTCGLTPSGSAWCWGRNVFGQLGDGSTQDSPIPMPVHGEYRFRRLAGGGAHTCGETRDGALYCWGSNIQGQLGDGSRDNRADPVRSAGDR